MWFKKFDTATLLFVFLSKHKIKPVPQNRVMKITMLSVICCRHISIKAVRKHLQNLESIDLLEIPENLKVFLTDFIEIKCVVYNSYKLVNAHIQKK